jgi:hypothetical protein
LALGRNGGCQVNTRTGELTFGFGRLELDAQTGREIGLSEAERFLEEAACRLGELGTPLGSGDLLPCRFDAHTRHIHFGQQTLTFDLELGLSLDGLRTGACNA